MGDVNYLAIVVAALVAFVLSSAWYIVFGKQRAELLGVAAAAETSRPPAWMMLVELVRSIVLGAVLAGLAANLDVVDWTGALGLGFVLWVGFPFVLLTGSVIWDHVPWELAAIHAGDWLLKLLVVSVIVSVWR